MLCRWGATKQTDADQERRRGRQISRLNYFGSAHPGLGMGINASTHHYLPTALTKRNRPSETSHFQLLSFSNLRCSQYTHYCTNCWNHKFFFFINILQVVKCNFSQSRARPLIQFIYKNVHLSSLKHAQKNLLSVLNHNVCVNQKQMHIHIFHFHIHILRCFHSVIHMSASMTSV